MGDDLIESLAFWEPVVFGASAFELRLRVDDAAEKVRRKETAFGADGLKFLGASGHGRRSGGGRFLRAGEAHEVLSALGEAVSHAEAVKVFGERCGETHEVPWGGHGFTAKALTISTALSWIVVPSSEADELMLQGPFEELLAVEIRPAAAARKKEAQMPRPRIKGNVVVRCALESTKSGKTREDGAENFICKILRGLIEGPL